MSPARPELGVERGQINHKRVFIKFNLTIPRSLKVGVISTLMLSLGHDVQLIINKQSVTM